MNALAEGRMHVPYRDSKLTRLLQGCLGGGARTSIIVTIPPGCDDNGEALNALRFASRASKVKVAAKVMRFTDFEGMYNEAQRALDAVEQREQEKVMKLERAGETIERQEKELERLRDEVRTLKSQMGMSGGGGGHGNGNYEGQGQGQGQCPHCGNRSNSSTGGGSYGSSGNSKSQSDQLHALSEQHLKDLATVRRELETKVSAQKKQVSDAEQEVATLQYELQSERTRHLSSLEDVKKYHQRSVELENSTGIRIQVTPPPLSPLPLLPPSPLPSSPPLL